MRHSRAPRHRDLSVLRLRRPERGRGPFRAASAPGAHSCIPGSCPGPIYQSLPERDTPWVSPTLRHSRALLPSWGSGQGLCVALVQSRKQLLLGDLRAPRARGGCWRGRAQAEQGLRADGLLSRSPEFWPCVCWPAPRQLKILKNGKTGLQENRTAE